MVKYPTNTTSHFRFLLPVLQIDKIFTFFCSLKWNCLIIPEIIQYFNYILNRTWWLIIFLFRFKKNSAYGFRYLTYARKLADTVERFVWLPQKNF